MFTDINPVVYVYLKLYVQMMFMFRLNINLKKLNIWCYYMNIGGYNLSAFLYETNLSSAKSPLWSKLSLDHINLKTI